jgi:hypothetical protein
MNTQDPIIEIKGSLKKISLENTLIQKYDLKYMRTSHQILNH